MNTTSVALVIDGVKAMFLIAACDVKERINQPFSAVVTLTAHQSAARVPIETLDVLGKVATLTLDFFGVERVFTGLIEAIEDDLGQSTITIAPSIARLARTLDYRVFVATSATDIVKKVLDEHGISVELKASRIAKPRAQCVQVWESDLAFVSRLLAEEGMSWYPARQDKTIVVADAPSTFDDDGPSLTFREDAGIAIKTGVHAARLRRRVTSDAVTLRDYDFKKPELELEGKAGKGQLEWFEEPAGFDKPDFGRDLAAIRLAELSSEDVVLEGRATAPDLEAGHVFSLASAPFDAMNGRWLVVGVEHLVRTGTASASDLSYENTFRAAKADSGVRPPRTARKRGGVGTTTVTGKSGEEISLDDFGRTRMLLRWDRRSAADEKASTFARVMQPQISGAIFNPRVGWEEIVGFTEGGAEIPVVLGRVYNGEQTPPTGLPANKAETHFGTLTTPKGSSGNFLKLSDNAGQEKLSIQASGDYNEQTENDKVMTIAANHDRKIGASRKLIVKERYLNNVDGAQTLGIAGLRKITTDSNLSVAAANEVVVVGAARIFRVGGDYVTKTPHVARLVVGKKGELPIEHQNVFTKGVATFLVKGDVNTKAALHEGASVAGIAYSKVSGAQNINCTGYGLSVKGMYQETYASKTVKAGGKIAETFRLLSYTFKDGGKITGADVAIEATAKMTIKADGLTIEMTPGSIEIKGDFNGMTASVEEGTHKYD